MTTPIKDWRQYRFGFLYGQKYPNDKYWGSLAGQKHIGLDVLCPIGTPVYSPVDGVVKTVEGKQGGLQIHLKSGKLLFRFLHLSKVLKEGEVKAGDKIALSGNSGEATNTPHMHYDISRDKLKLTELDNFIDPLKLHEVPIKVLVVAQQKPEMAQIEADYLYMGIQVIFDYKELTAKPKWVSGVFKQTTIYGRWWDVHIAPLASGYDCAVFVTDYWPDDNRNGYAEKVQRHGIWQIVVHDTKKPRKYYDSHWNGKNQIAGTIAHELSHILSNATGKTDTTHDMDRAGKALEQRFDMGNFKGWKVPGMIRLFRWADTFVKTGSPWSLTKTKSTRLVSRLETPENAVILGKTMTIYIPKF